MLTEYKRGENINRYQSLFKSRLMVMGWDAVESVGYSDEDEELAVELDDDGRGQEPVVFVTRSRGTRRSHDSRLPPLSPTPTSLPYPRCIRLHRFHVAKNIRTRTPETLELVHARDTTTEA